MQMSRRSEWVPTSLRQALPESVRRQGRAASVAVGRATARLRTQPDFIVIGAQRCGTTSLFRALMSHPDIVRPTTSKGVNYFDLNYFRGRAWYLAHFPTAQMLDWKSSGRSRPAVFEASGYYFYHPFAVERLAKDLPDAKLVVMLRDPVERAYSAYQHELARGFEWETFGDALALESERLVGELDRMRRDPGYESFTHRHHSYLRRGHYAEQLERVFAHVPREQVHVMMSEDFFRDPAAEFGALVDFLGLDQSTAARFDRYNAQPRGDMDPVIRDRLRLAYQPHDDKLAALLDRPLGWRTG